MKTVFPIWLATVLAVSAGLEFSETLQEIHAPVDAAKVTAEFSFSNAGEEPVTIRKYDSGCSCMGLRVKDGKLRYAPGESGLLQADFELGNFSGTVDKVIAVWLDDDAESEPSLRLTVRVHIPVLVALDPKTLHWDLAGDAAPKTIRITMNDERPTHVTAVSSSSPAFKPELKTIEKGKVYEVVVTPATIDTPGLGILRIETDSESPKLRLQQAFAVVRKPAAARP
jgi:hypothetical protein